MAKKYCALFFVFILIFGIWTLLVSLLDVQTVTETGKSVGFASVNIPFHEMTGVNFWLYHLTDLLEIIPLGIVAIFAFCGAKQLVQRKSVRLVDKSIINLGCLYAAMAAAYVIFELFPVNYRPVLINGEAEASYPSSTTVLVISVILSSVIWMHRHAGDRKHIKALTVCGILYSAFMVFGRLLSGVHWLTDIIGGALLSIGLLCGYLWLDGANSNKFIYKDLKQGLEEAVKYEKGLGKGKKQRLNNDCKRRGTQHILSKESPASAGGWRNCFFIAKREKQTPVF